MEILPSRSLFFVDADVSFALDPYPHLEPLMKRFDILAQENDAFEHFNTGWMWLRKGRKVAEAWREVYEMDMRSTSRDQYNFNNVSFLTGVVRANPPSFTPATSASRSTLVHILNSLVLRLAGAR